MIYCSQCGTQNRDGSKFCSNCAARLAPPSGLICPMCSTANPVETVFCNNCGARLVPLTGGPDVNRRDAAPPIKGLSLPAKPAAPPAEEIEDEPVTKEKIEDWLQKLRAEPPTEDEPPPLPIEKPVPPAPVLPPLSPAEPLPTWVKQVVPEEPAPESISPADSELKEELDALPAETREQLPDWLKELGAQTRLPEQAAEPEPVEPESVSVYQSPASADELPDWLKSQVEETPPAPGVQPPAPTARDILDVTQDQEAPGALEEIEPDQAPFDGFELAESEQTTTAPFELAERDQEPTTPFELAERDEEPPPPFLISEPVSIEPARPEEIPDWLAMLKPSEDISLEPSPPLTPSVAEEEEMSEWLRTPALNLPPQPIMPETIAGEVELSGPLTNLRGVLPLAIAMAEPHTMTPLAPPERRDGAHLFEEILSAPAADAVRTPRRARRRGIPSLRALIYLLLALAVIAPFFVPLNVSGASLKITGTPAAKFYDTVQALPADSTVLVAFDYDPSVAGEMDLLATTLVRHLVQRRVKIIALSTLETGPNIAQRVLGSAISDSPEYRYGAQYLNLGYLPGHEAGVARLANQGLPLNGKDFGKSQIIAQYPIAASVQTIGSIALTIELAGSEEPLKIWVEQFQPRVNAKIVVGSSAAVEPKAKTYLQAQQLIALVSGPVGAAQYEILTNQTGQAVTRIVAQSAAQLVLIGVILAGNVAYWIARLREKRDKENENG